MASICANSFITVAAARSADADGGLYSTWQHVEHYDILNDRLRRCSITIHSPMNHNLEALPLSSRAWAFQERLLSPRVVHFGEDEMYWECMVSTSCECAVFNKEPPRPGRMLSKHERVMFSGHEFYC